MPYFELLTPNDGDLLNRNLKNALTFIGQAQECLKPASQLWLDLNAIWAELDNCVEAMKEV